MSTKTALKSQDLGGGVEPAASASPGCADQIRGTSAQVESRLRVRKRLIEYAVAIAIVVAPVFGVFLLPFAVQRFGVSLSELGLLVGTYVVSMAGITVGFHRCFTHRSFEPSLFVKVVLGVLGSFAWQGPILRWAADHRRHHAFSDRIGDPHSPRMSSSSVRGFFYSHFLWLFDRERTRVRLYAMDLLKDPVIAFIDRMYPVWAASSLVIPSVIGFWVLGGVEGFTRGLLWGGLVRIFLTHQATWAVNSVCHLVGRRNFETQDNSRNNAAVSFFTLGEGWHNNHHQFPSSARQGVRSSEIDISWMIIAILERIKLVSDVRLPSLIKHRRISAEAVRSIEASS